MIASTTFNGLESTITLRVDPDKMTGVVNGCLWFGCTDGKPEFISRLNPLPAAKDDDQVLPFFDGGSSHKILDFHPPSFSPTFEIQHLCGYDYTPAKYEAEAAKLERYGFHCLRSRRGSDGKYWEVWRLLGYWSAEGDLKPFCETIQKLSDKEKIKKVVHWLCQNCSFGSLDVTCQRAAMVIE